MSGRVPMGKAFSVVAREADARIAAGHREHTAHRDGGILHPAAQLLISALQRTGKGFKLCLTPEARQRKVRFKPANFGHYITIQLELWINIFRRR